MVCKNCPFSAVVWIVYVVVMIIIIMCSGQFSCSGFNEYETTQDGVYILVGIGALGFIVSIVCSIADNFTDKK